MYLNIEANFVASLFYNASNVIHAKLLCELVEDAHLAPLCWVVDRKLDAPHLQMNISHQLVYVLVNA